MTPRRRSALLVALFLAILSILSAGCSPLTRHEQPFSGSSVHLLRDGGSAGQTFVARERGLSGFTLRLEPTWRGQGFLTLSLFSSPDSGIPLATDTVHWDELTAPGDCTFSFAPQTDSNGRTYYARLTLTGSGEVAVPLAGGDTYIDGAFYADGQPQDAQSAFASSYSLPQAALGRAGEAAGWILYALAAVFLFVLPGWAVGAVLPGLSRFGVWARLAFAPAFSLSLFALTFLAAWLAGVPIGPWAAWIIPVLAAAVILLRLRRMPALPRLRLRAPDLTLAGILLILWISRCAAVRALDLPLWGDGINHTINTQLVIDHGGLFASWLPYADIATFTYHFGFHVSAALWHWVTGQDAAASVLWTGQALNVLAALALYPLAVRLGRSPWAGVAAVTAAGLLSPIPFLFADWSRYTQLTGEVVAPAVLAGTLILQNRSRRRWAWRLAVALLWAGLALSHYRVFLAAVVVLPAALVPLALRPSRWLRLRNALAALAIGVGLAAPWLLHSLAGGNPQYLVRSLSRAVSPLPPDTWWNAIRFQAGYYPAALWILCGAGLLVGALRKPRAGLALAAAFLLLFFAANPGLLRLPGSTIIDPFAVACILFIPLSLGAGMLAGAIARLPLRTKAAPILAAVLHLALGGWSAGALRESIQPSVYALAAAPDIRAAAWIRENLPADARLLIPSFYSPGHKAYAGADGGWWLPWLAGRQVDVWPLNVMVETADLARSPGGLYAMADAVAELGIGDPATLAMMDAWGIRYVYIGQRRGAVGNPEHPTLTPEAVEASGRFRLIYAQDRVRIYERIRD